MISGLASPKQASSDRRWVIIRKRGKEKPGPGLAYPAEAHGATALLRRDCAIGLAQTMGWQKVGFQQ